MESRVKNATSILCKTQASTAAESTMEGGRAEQEARGGDPCLERHASRSTEEPFSRAAVSAGTRKQDPCV